MRKRRAGLCIGQEEGIVQGGYRSLLRMRVIMS